MKRLFIIPLSFLLLSACSGHHVDKADLETVRAAGARRALELATGTEASTDTMKMETALIDIRSREQRMRDEGYPDAADAYIESFLATLDSVNPSLAAAIK